MRNEGDVQVRVPAPYGISYQSLTPKAGECDNLLVPVCLSASHIALGSIRMEPVYMILGQSCGTAAVLALSLIHISSRNRPPGYRNPRDSRPSANRPNRVRANRENGNPGH